MKTIGSGPPGQQRQDWIIRISVALLASLVTATIGPFATYEEFSFSGRLLYWGGLIMGLVVPAYFIRSAVYRFLSGSSLKQDLVVVGVLSIVIGPIVWAFNLFVMGFGVGTPVMLFEHIAVVALICAVPAAIRGYLRMSLNAMESEAAPDKTEAPRTPQVVDAKAPFLRRLPPEARGMVVRVSADDHQVDVWTDRGEAKLRSRFGDVLEELEPFDGAQIHRSHWVAFSEIDSVVPEGRRHTVYLVCGMKIPVSQTGLRTLNEAGFSVTDQPSASVLSKI